MAQGEICQPTGGNIGLESMTVGIIVLPVSQQEVGMPADYVNKLARMFQDIKVSEDLNQSFKEMHKHNKLALPGKRTADSDYLCCILAFVYVSCWCSIAAEFKTL